MACSKLKCRGCGNRFPREEMISINGGNFHSIECAIAYANKPKQKEKGRRLIDREFNKETAKMKKASRKRLGKGGYYEALKKAIHAYVKHVLLRGSDCYTCGKPQLAHESGRKWHVGHYMPAKSVDPRRFMIENLRIQCYTCNALNSGRQQEYKKRLTKEKGADFVEWLECEANHKSLQERYPTAESLQDEIKRYRRLYREGLHRLQEAS